jgi:uncharacterized membrane protein HdeD (DUF308 family)
MRIFEIIYYQAFLFYSKKLKEDDPHFTTTWGVGIAFAFITIFSLMGIKDNFICTRIKTIYLFGFAMIIYGIFYYIFTKEKRRERIVKEKPLFRNSTKLSRMIAILYFGIAIAMMFIGPILAKHFYDINCK